MLARFSPDRIAIARHIISGMPDEQIAELMDYPKPFTFLSVRYFMSNTLLFITLCGSLSGQTLRVVGTTANQIHVRLTALDAQPCLYSSNPPLDALDPLLFPSSNSDGGGALIRDMFIGAQGSRRAVDGTVHSLSTQALSAYQITSACPTGTATVTAYTSNIPLGNTYSPPPQVDPDNPGYWLWPSRNWQRGQKIIDPVTGILSTYVTTPLDQIAVTLTNQPFTFLSAGTGWTLSGSKAVCASTSCGDLRATISIAMNDKYVDTALNYLNLLLHSSSGSGLVTVCTSPDNAGCDVYGRSLSAQLTATPAEFTLGSQTPIDTWRLNSAPNNLTTRDVIGKPFSFVIRSTGPATLNLAWTMVFSSTHSVPSGGNFDQCADKMDANGWFHCVSRSNAKMCGGSQLFAVRGNGEFRYLGDTGLCLDDAPWDHNDPNTIWGWHGDIYKWTYDGSDIQVAPGTPVNWRKTTIVSKTDLDNLMRAYDATWDPTKFSFAATMDVGHKYLIASGRRSSQNSYAWGAAWTIGDGNPWPDCNGCGLKSAIPLYQRGAGRYCGSHSQEIYGGDLGWFSPYDLNGPDSGSDPNGPGFGPYLSALAADAPAGSTQLLINTDISSSLADQFVYHIQPGDTLRLRAATTRPYGGGELVTVDGVTPAGSQLRLTLHRPTIAVSSSGALLFGQCQGGPTTVWNPETNSVETEQYKGGVVHQTSRGCYYVDENYRFQICCPDVVACRNVPITQATMRSPLFAGFQAPNNGNTGQSHPTTHQVDASASERPYFSDGLVFSGGVHSLTKVDGYQHLWKVTNRQYPMVPKVLPLAGACGAHSLMEISGPGATIDDSKPYTFLLAQVAGEGIPGSQPGDIFVDCPNITNPNCSGTSGGVLDTDGCVWPWATYMQAAPQIGFAANIEGGQQDPRGQYYYGGGYGRIIQRLHAPIPGLTTLGQWPGLGNKWAARELPDASGMWTSGSVAERTDMLLLTLSPIPPKDTIDGSTWIPLRVTHAAVPGVEKAYIEFWEGDGPGCSARREICVADSLAIDPAHPYKWPSLGAGGDANNRVNGVPCVSGCTIPIPTHRQSKVTYRWKMTDATGAVVFESPVYRTLTP